MRIQVGCCRLGKPYLPTSGKPEVGYRTRNLEIPGLVLAHHPGMTAIAASKADRPALRTVCGEDRWSVYFTNEPLSSRINIGAKVAPLGGRRAQHDPHFHDFHRHLHGAGRSFAR